MSIRLPLGRCVIFLLFAGMSARAGVGDPQIRTDHPWYPGELACSTFERLFATQAELYERVVGVRPTTDEQKALAAWLWRNTHYWHGEEGAEDLWGKGFTAGGDLRTREYWTGLFAHGFGLCGTTHSQWVAEMEALFGHCRGRAVGVNGHNTFEVFLTGGPYGAGKWALLDHDQSTVVFDKSGKALLSMREVAGDWKRLTDRKFAPGRQHGWLVCGLDAGDATTYSRYAVAEYLAGYSGPPPMVHLRRGEKLRRYLQPGLEDGKTFAFWGRNYKTSGIPGPERAETWVNQPEKMHGSRDGTGHHPGPGRFGDAMDVTDRVKGRRRYLLRLHAGAKDLAGSGLTITTVCQANAAILPRLKDGGTTVRFASSAEAMVSAGPNLPHAEAHRVEGNFGTPRLTLELKTPRGEPAVTLYAAAHVNSSNPPDPKVKYQIEYSTDAGRTWKPVVKDWTIPRRGDEPADFW